MAAFHTRYVDKMFAHVARHQPLQNASQLHSLDFPKSEAIAPVWLGQGTEEWTAELGFPIANDWRPWLTDANGENTTAHAVTVGYTVQFGGDSKDFRFATVMGSGHEVPTFKPIPAFAAMKRFQEGLPL